MDYSKLVLLTPKNDEESLQIVKIAEAAGIPLLVSTQPHGAKLELEKDLVERVREVNQEATTIVIVEIPGVKEEEALRSAGFEVEVIDHHRYAELDRMQTKSSLEQFLVKFEINDNRLAELGFEAEMVRGVGIIDRGFLWVLRAEVPDKELAKRMRDYYRGLTVELGKENKDVDAVAAEAWALREVVNDVLIVRTEREDVPFRAAISFLVADNYDAPPATIVVEGKRRISVQESNHAPELFAAYGGFMFGGELCWGIQATTERALPEVAEIVARLS